MSGDSIFTYVLGAEESITFSFDDGITVLAMELTAGTGTYLGTLSVGGHASVPVSLVVDDPITVSNSNVISNFTITAGAASSITIIASR